MRREFPDLLQPITTELDLVFTRLEDLLSPLAKSLIRQFQKQFEIDLVLPPGFVLASAYFFKQQDRALTPALLMALVHLGNTFHNFAREVGGREQQLLILVGDHIYSQLYKLLSGNTLFFLLERFARMISALNEGSTIWETGGYERSEEVAGGLEKQYGTLFGESCAIGCLFAGGDEEQQSRMRLFGTEFGVAYGVRKRGLDPAFGPVPHFAGKGLLGRFAREILLSPTDKRSCMAF